jgi:phosphatidate cytidylyltransferase
VKKRTLSTIVLWLAVGGLLYFFGAPAGALLIVFLAATSQYELYGMLSRSGYQPLTKTGVVLGILFLAAAYLMPQFSATERFTQMGYDGLALALVVIAAGSLFTKTPDRVATLVATLAGFLYIPYLLHFFVRILQLSPEPASGLILAFWVVVLVKFADIGAYLTGSMIGKNKLAPSLSPGKTWEGALGGLAISALLSAGYAWFFGRMGHFPEGLTPVVAALIALPVAAVSIVSDLLESAFKRRAEVKDSGNTIPGIGGSFDLTDSLVLSAPVAYGFLLLFA